MRRRLLALDGIRGIAIVMVMLLHAAGDYFPGGAIGVDVFFALSAFLITSLILHELRSTSAFSFRNFYERRARRLGPALLLWLLLIAPLTAVVIDEAGTIVSSTFASLFYFGNYAIGLGWVPVGAAYSQVWSLAIEEQFYLAWPLVLMVVVRRWSVRAAMGLVAVVAVLGITAQQSLPNSYFMPWGHSLGIVGGCLLALLAHAGLPRALQTILGSQWTAIVVLAALAALCVAPSQVSSAAGVNIFALGGLGGCLLIGHAVTRHDGLSVRLLEHPGLRWLGRRSYGLYLYHRTLAILVPALIPGITLTFAAPLVFVVSFVIAEASWRLVEKPVLDRGRGPRTTPDSSADGR